MSRGIGLQQWFVAAALAVGLIGAVRADEKTPADNKACPMKQLASIDVRMNRFGQVLVPVTLAGHDAWMTLNLEQGLMILYPTAVADWHLAPIHMGNGGRRIVFRGKTVTDMVRTDFTLGSQGFQNWPLVLAPAADSPPVRLVDGKPIVGQLSSRFLIAVDLELNLAQSKIVLFDHVKCGSNAVYWGAPSTAVPLNFDDTGLLHFPMELEHQEIQTSFDTSSGASRIISDVTKKYFGFDESSPGLQSETLPNGAETRSYRAMDLTAKDLSLQHAKVILWPMKECHPDRTVGGRDGIGCLHFFGISPFSIGTDLLKDLRVYIASQEKVVYFTRVPQYIIDTTTTPPHSSAPPVRTVN